MLHNIKHTAHCMLNTILCTQHILQADLMARYGLVLHLETAPLKFYGNSTNQVSP